MKIQREIPANQLSTPALIARLKYQNNNPQSAYGLFVKAQSLKPEISMPEFRKIWPGIMPDPWLEIIEFDFTPTHIDTLLNKQVQIDQKEGYFKIVWEHGMTGTQPGIPDSRFKKLG